ncbi:MFS general substrate transporter [Lentithecium fluviatile CBS 122367]|uniref:MFS general substrate transporter n=1 Tax=Lentithecium fluviatile CBS 122367 TaxID=1168545 RepID=A0A6G1ISM2_9PLEO|nr:MFS general substrate transporter [Lentithecium fluviatile CBS 122367]
MAEKFSRDTICPRRDTNSTTDTKCTLVREQSRPKEGGKEAWLTVIGSFFVWYSSYGVINSFGFFQDYYQNDFLKSTAPSTISFIGTLQIALMNSLSTVSGAICDTHGIRYLYMASGTCTAIALLALSFSRPVISHTFLSQGLLMGCAIAFGVQPSLTVVGQHFKHKRALTMGIVSSGSSIGGLCFTIMFERLRPTIGFPWTMRIAALKVLACYSFALWVSTSKPTRNPIKLSTLLDFRGFLDARYAVLAVACWIANLGLYVPGYQIKSYAHDAFHGVAIGNYLLPIMLGSSIPGMIIGGLLGDLLGRLNCVWPVILNSGFLCLSLWLLAPSLPIVVLFTCLYGFGFGVYVAVLPSAVTQITPDNKIGARMGAFYSIAAVSSLIGAPIGSALIRRDDAGHAIGGEEGYKGLIAFAVSIACLLHVLWMCADTW